MASGHPQTQDRASCCEETAARPLTGRASKHSITDDLSDLQHGVGQQQAVADVVQEAGVGAADGVVLEDLLGGLRLARATLPGDEDEMVVELAQHGAEHVVGQSVAGGNTQSGNSAGVSNLWSLTDILHHGQPSLVQ